MVRLGCDTAVTKPRIYILYIYISVPGLKGLRKTPKIVKYKIHVYEINSKH